MPVFKSFKNHTRLTRIHSNGPSVSWIRPRFIRLFVRFTQVANRVTRVFCVRRALVYLQFINRVGYSLDFRQLMSNDDAWGNNSEVMCVMHNFCICLIKSAFLCCILFCFGTK